MKHLSKLIAAAMTLVMFGFFGCSDISTGGKTYVSEGVTDGNAEKKSISLEAEADDDVIVFSSSETARTILPNAVNADTLHFYLVYRDTINATTDSIEEVTFTKDAGVSTYTKGTVTKSFTLSNYKFTLYAVTAAMYTKLSGGLNTGNIATNASYVGYANADLRYKDVVTFHLKPNTSSSGKGRVELSISNVDDWVIPVNYVVYAGLYNVEDDYTDSPVYPTDAYKELYARSTSDTGTLDATNKSYIKSAASTYDVPAGEYNLIVAYCYQPVTAGVTKNAYIYSEKIIVLMNEETIATVKVPDILEKAPAAPTNLTVAYQNPATIETEYYPVQFMWSDNSSTEREFLLQVLEYTDASAYFEIPSSDANWDALLSSGTVTTYTKLAMQNSSYYISGSLNKNSTAVTMYLPLGARFIARLCASNDAGPSDYAYVKWAKIDEKYRDEAGTEESVARYASISSSTTTGTSSATSDAWTVFTDDITTINRFRITYDLNGGKFYDNAATPAVLASEQPASEPALVHYASQYTDTSTAGSPAASSVAHVILTPDGLTTQTWYTDLAGLTETASPAALTLADEGNYWDKWLVDTDTGTTYTQTVTYLTYDTEDSNLSEINVGTTDFIGNIKYFPYSVTSDTVAASTALGSQPTATGWNSGKYTLGSVSSTHASYGDGSATPYYEYYRVRKAVSQLYTGYANLTLVAHYDTTKVMNIVVEDLSVYELNPTALIIAFAKSGAAVTTAVNVGGTLGSDVTDVNYVNTTLDGVLQVSLSKVNQITFTVDTDVATFPILSYTESTNTISAADGTYDNVHLKISKIGSSKTLVDQDWNSGKAWTVAFSSWTEGNYLVEFTATTSQMPSATYSVVTVIKITD